jgi:hypothetical protein
LNFIRRSSLLAAAAAAAVALGPAGAAAQPRPEAAAMAEALFQQGRELFKGGKYAEACPKLAESQRLDPKLGTLLNLALCHEKQGKTASAWAEYLSAANIAHRDGQKEREGFAREQLASVEKMLAKVTLKVSAPEPGLTVTLDDQPMSGAALGTPLPIDPGKHRITAGASGKKTWSSEIDVPAQGGEVLVSIPALEVAEVPPPSPPPPAATVVIPPPTAPVAPPPIVPPPAPATGNTSPVLMGVGFGVGGAGVVVGAITGIITLVNAGTIRGKCGSDNKCTPDQQSAIDSANTLANVSNASFGIGLAGVVVGVVGVVLRPSAPAPRTGVRITPFVGPGTAGLAGSF